MDHIEALRQLVEADRWIERVRAQRDHLPERTELADVEGELRQLLADLKAAQAVLDPAAASLEVARQQTAALEQRAAQLAAAVRPEEVVDPLGPAVGPPDADMRSVSVPAPPSIELSEP